MHTKSSTNDISYLLPPDDSVCTRPRTCQCTNSNTLLILISWSIWNSWQAILPFTRFTITNVICNIIIGVVSSHNKVVITSDCLHTHLANVRHVLYLKLCIVYTRTRILVFYYLFEPWVFTASCNLHIDTLSRWWCRGRVSCDREDDQFVVWGYNQKKVCSSSRCFRLGKDTRCNIQLYSVKS